MYKVLTTKDKEWDELVEKLPIKDILYSSEYYAVNAKFAGYDAEMFFYGNKNNFVIYPYLKKRISSLPFFRVAGNESKGTFFDISNLEYGGPAVVGPKTIIKNFLTEFHRYCLKSNIVTEWCRLHPFLENHRGLKNVREVQDVYYVDLTKSAEQIFKEFKKAARNAVNKAKRENVEVVKTNKKEDLDEFYRIYSKTMDTYKAEKFYYYSREFFDDLFAMLKDSVNLFIAKKGEKIIAASLFLSDRSMAHYYLSTRDPTYSNLFPNNLILYEVMLYYKKKGQRIFNLGGEYGTQESLAKFKAQFTLTSKPFYRQKIIHNKKIYDRLCAIYKKYIKEKNIADYDKNYFPFYRGLK